MLGEFIQKANLSNIMIIITIAVGTVTAWNQIGKIDGLEYRVNQLTLENINQAHQIEVLEASSIKLDSTLSSIEVTLKELNNTVIELKTTLQAMKEK